MGLLGLSVVLRVIHALLWFLVRSGLGLPGAAQESVRLSSREPMKRLFWPTQKRLCLREVILTAVFTSLALLVPLTAAQDITEPRVSTRFVQEALQALGHYDAGIDGDMGPVTRAALREWQATMGLEDTGELTQQQSDMLIRLSAAAGLADAKERLANMPAAGKQPIPSGPSNVRIKKVEQALRNLEEQLERTNTQVDANQQAVSEMNDLVDQGFEGMDSLTLRLDSLSRQLGAVPETLENQWDRIDENNARLFQAVIGMEKLRAQFEELRQDPRRAARSPRQGQSTEETSAPAGVMRIQPRLLCALLAGLLIPLAVASYSGGAGIGRHKGGRTGWVATAWSGGAVGFYLVGAGIMLGSSYMGWLGMPNHLFSERLLSSLGELAPTTLNAIVVQVILASIVSVVVSSGAQHRLSAGGHLIVALLVSGLVYPLFGHWANASIVESVSSGWLVEKGFILPAAATNVALLGGTASLALAHGLGLIGKASAQSGPGIDAVSGSRGSLVLLWVAWIGIVGATEPEALPMAVVLLSLSASAAGAALSVLVVDRLSSFGTAWGERLPFSVLAGLIAAPGGFGNVSLAELAVLGVVAGLAASALMRLLEQRSQIDLRLPAALVAGGFFGTLAPVLLSSGGFLFLGSSLGLLFPQLLGIGAALALAVVAGVALAWPLGHIRFFRGQP